MKVVKIMPYSTGSRSPSSIVCLPEKSTQSTLPTGSSSIRSDPSLPVVQTPAPTDLPSVTVSKPTYLELPPLLVLTPVYYHYEIKFNPILMRYMIPSGIQLECKNAACIAFQQYFSKIFRGSAEFFHAIRDLCAEFESLLNSWTSHSKEERADAVAMAVKTVADLTELHGMIFKHSQAGVTSFASAAPGTPTPLASVCQEHCAINHIRRTVCIYFCHVITTCNAHLSSVSKLDPRTNDLRNTKNCNRLVLQTLNNFIKVCRATGETLSPVAPYQYNFDYREMLQMARALADDRSVSKHMLSEQSLFRLLRQLGSMPTYTATLPECLTIPFKPQQ